ncbi:hypothetical protein ACIBVL_36680 [Streptomyces sp. NPDC049687]
MAPRRHPGQLDGTRPHAAGEREAAFAAAVAVAASDLALSLLRGTGIA